MGVDPHVAGTAAVEVEEAAEAAETEAGAAAKAVGVGAAAPGVDPVVVDSSIMFLVARSRRRLVY